MRVRGEACELHSSTRMIQTRYPCRLYLGEDKTKLQVKEGMKREVLQALNELAGENAIKLNEGTSSVHVELQHNSLNLKCNRWFYADFCSSGRLHGQVYIIYDILLYLTSCRQQNFT